MPTPVAYKGKVLLVRDRGEVECIDPETGKIDLERRLSEKPIELLRVAADRRR